MIFLNTLVYAQDTLTVIAVGEAESEKEGMAFVSPSTKDLNAKQTKDVKNIVSILISDFDFYRDLFLVEKNSISSKDNFSGKYIIEFQLAKAGGKINMATSLYDKVQKKEVFVEKKDIDFQNVRSFAHEISHNLYRAITGKVSIFKTKILFVSDRTSTRKKLKKEIYIMDFDGARKQQITYLNSMIIAPAISHDNSKIMYSLMEGKWQKASSGNGVQKIKNINLHLMDLKTKRTRLLSGVKGINSGAVFDKDSENIYLTLSHQRNADIYKMNLKTRKKTRVTNHFSDDVDPHINADGSLLTFLSGRPGKAMIYTSNPKGVEKDIKRISFVGRFNAAPRFNPDGSEIVFSSWVDNRFDIYRIGSDGRNLVRLTKNFGSNEEPWYSPDGQFIVFTSQRVITRKKAVQDVYIMNRDGEIIRKISESYGKVYTPRWSN